MEGDSNEKKSGGMSDIRSDDDMTDVDLTEKKKGRPKKGRGTDDCKLNFKIDTNISLTNYS